jgi:branched-chain amino acid aminotransferase
MTTIVWASTPSFPAPLLVSGDDARTVAVHGAFDHGVLVGDGAFETLRVVDGVAFARRRHLERLTRSATGLGLERPDLALVHDALDAVLDAGRDAAAAGGAPLGRLRVTLTSGPGPLGSARGDLGPSLTVIGTPATPWAPTAHVAVAPWPRNERGPLTGLKTVSYADNVVALHHARGQGADEAVFLNTRGELCEGTGSNVFVVRDGVVATPPLSSGCLAGITRALVLEHTDAVERTLSLDDLLDADEAFLTSTTRVVHPIETVDGVALRGVAGQRTTAAMRAMAALAARTLDP